jgi:hypothetical protein
LDERTSDSLSKGLGTADHQRFTVDDEYAFSYDFSYATHVPQPITFELKYPRSSCSEAGAGSIRLNAIGDLMGNPTPSILSGSVRKFQGFDIITVF